MPIRKSTRLTTNQCFWQDLCEAITPLQIFNIVGEKPSFFCDYWVCYRTPWFDFLVVFVFLHHGKEEVKRHLLWKFHKNIQRKNWSNVPPKLLTCIGFLYKVVHKTAVSESSMALGRFNLTFLSLGQSLWNLAHLFIMFMAAKLASEILIFAKGLSYGLSKWTNGVKSSQNFERS